MRNNKCISCPSSCSNCNVSDAGLTVCTTCANGYFMSDDRICLKCSDYLDPYAIRCAGPFDDPKLDKLQVT